MKACKKKRKKRNKKEMRGKKEVGISKEEKKDVQSGSIECYKSCYCDSFLVII